MVLAFVLAVFAQAATAQFPNKAIHLIIPFPSGGSSELGARIVAEPLGELLGTPILVETRPGGDGIVGAQAVMRAAPDGYTLFYATNTAFNWVPVTRKTPPYDPTADFTPVSLVGYFGFFLFTNPGVPAKSVEELIGYARANPGKLYYGTGTSTAQLLAAQVKHINNLDIVEVPYRGDGPLGIDLLGGRVQMAFATAGTLIPQVKEGRLRVLAAMFPNRSPLLPDVPTAQEAGLGSMNIRPWAGLFGPAKMSREIADRLAGGVAAVLARQDVRERLAKIAFEAKSSTPEELAAFLEDQIKIWRETARRVGIREE